ncbi:MAG: multiheme c-type cytochrome [Chloroflexota bacterium]
MTNPGTGDAIRSARLLIIGLVAVIVVLGLSVVMLSIGRSAAPTQPGQVDALATSNDDCVTCHRNATPGIVQQYGHSTMAGANVACRDCHEVEAGYPGAAEHEGAYVLAQPTTAMCGRCHESEVAQFNQSRHGLPAFVAVDGSKDLSPTLLAAYQAIPEGQFGPDKARNIIAQMEGEDITRFACETCHNIGKPAADDSVGQCQKCHIRHEFSLEQARKPETCNNCHIGPDHPQWEIYFESKHGIAYSTGGDDWNWTAEAGTLTVSDFPAPTCATCHFSGFGGAGTTHDTGDRLTWYLFSSISERRPAWQDNQVRMQSVCGECHNKGFVQTFYADADAATEAVNAFIVQSNDIQTALKDQGLLTDAPFDEPFDFIHYETWHHYGRTAKFGVWMQGADYTQWHGAYEVVKGLAELRTLADEKTGK